MPYDGLVTVKFGSTEPIETVLQNVIDRGDEETPIMISREDAKFLLSAYKLRVNTEALAALPQRFRTGL